MVLGAPLGPLVFQSCPDFLASATRKTAIWTNHADRGCGPLQGLQPGVSHPLGAAVLSLQLPKQTNKKRNKQTNKQTKKERNKQTNKKRKKERNKQKKERKKQTNKQTKRQRNQQARKQANKQTACLLLFLFRPLMSALGLKADRVPGPIVLGLAKDSKSILRLAEEAWQGV